MMSFAAADRRGFLKTCVGVTAGTLLMPKLAFAAAGAPERRLSFYNTHTGEQVKAVYWADNAFVPEELARLDKVLRDFRTGDVHPIDRELFHQLYRVQSLIDADGNKPFHIISGYRSPKTNAMLATHSSGVAKKSLHQQGKAIDVRLPGTDTARLRAAALSMKAGGVGYYPDSDFVHMDTGRARFW